MTWSATGASPWHAWENTAGDAASEPTTHERLMLIDPPGVTSPALGRPEASWWSWTTTWPLHVALSCLCTVPIMWPRWGYKFIHHSRHPLHHSDVSGRLWPSSSRSNTTTVCCNEKQHQNSAARCTCRVRHALRLSSLALTWLPSSGKCESELRPAGFVSLTAPKQVWLSEPRNSRALLA